MIRTMLIALAVLITSGLFSAPVFADIAAGPVSGYSIARILVIAVIAVIVITAIIIRIIFGKRKK